MTQICSAPDLEIRPFKRADEREVMALLDATLPRSPIGERTTEFFRWKHFENPFGPSLMLIASTRGRIIGLRAFMRWQLTVKGRSFAALRAVDTATHPAFQGMGVFSRLTREALRSASGQTDLVFNTPNGASLPGYLKMGWQTIGKVPASIRVRRPLQVAAGLSSIRAGCPRSARSQPLVNASPAVELLRDEEAIASLIQRASAELDGRFATARNPAYLRWRYGATSFLDYRAVHEERRGELVGLAIFRVRRRGGLWETDIAEVIVRAGDRAVARRLIRQVMDAAATDHLITCLPRKTGSAQAARRRGFLPLPVATFVVNPLSPKLDPDPTELRSWALSLGDLEVF